MGGVFFFLLIKSSGHDFGGWWLGSHLTVETCRKSCGHMIDDVGVIGPTALQVGSSLAAAVCWGILNPNSGANLPENLPSEYIIQLALPWLGEWKSVAHNWRPTSSDKNILATRAEKESMSSSESSSSDESDDDEPDNNVDEDDSSDTSDDSDGEDGGAANSSGSKTVNNSPVALRSSPSPSSSIYCNSRDNKNILQFHNFVATPLLVEDN